MTIPRTIQKIKAELITSENFSPYGQVIFASKDGKTFDTEDAQLILDKGIPRFYIMQLQKRGTKFHNITRHMQCTQCLGSLQGKDWLIAVCPPNNDINEPELTKMKAFRIPGNCFIKFNLGTWHAGPYFEHDVVDFYNLELSNTNIVDHYTYSFLNHQTEFEIV